ncbi:hypothetical protein Cch01nite_08710 [Cellulomonas chitinilytica]|uniref:DUF4350 domain-containing protein n=1 Tax=Cellulomonas chitinilytica TaxID=398759 RepID=A0A919P0Z8_9CELL|nr:DUF4350 domain-containing protein [Cellulomonas chitinilytica]GIG20147.1 hypothetical protein Cch01nite_08710 [Cellulomonas chitinilytica]
MTATTAPTVAAQPVVGDGTSTRTRASARWRRFRAPLAILGLLALVGLLAALPEPRTSTTAVAPDNPGPTGARAAARILEDQGVDVRYVRRVADAVAQAAPDSTLLVVGGMFLDGEQLDALDGTGADLVLVGYTGIAEQLSDGLLVGGTDGGPAVRDAGCDDPDAVAAGTATVSGSLRATGPGATVCFAGDDPESGAYAVVGGQRPLTALTDTAPLTNEHLAEEGNAALVLRMLGKNERLVWFVPSLDDLSTTGGDGGPALGDLVPPRVRLVGLMLVLVVVVAALWRGRRLGRLVTEPLPVVVRAGETTRGRGRLYRRSRAYGHAAAALRAGAASRCATRLGLPRSAGAVQLVDAVSRATGRDAAAVEHLLYGPPPRDDAGLARLALDLDHLESEVHRT